jgi:hypothetical protein
MKGFIINNCQDCPFIKSKGHKFTKITYYCSASMYRNTPKAIRNPDNIDDKIRSWCPLIDMETLVIQYAIDIKNPEIINAIVAKKL